MKELKLEVTKLCNEDVIATSSKNLTPKGNYVFCIYMSDFDENITKDFISFDGTTSIPQGVNPGPTSLVGLKNVYGQNAEFQTGVWYAQYSDGNNSYIYKCSDVDGLNHTHPAN